VPAVVAAVPLQIQRECSIAEALVNHKWVTDIRSGLSLIGLVEFFHQWDIMQEKELSKEEDRHIWRLDKYGLFSSKSAYRAFFQGAITFEPWQRI
jgi:hypothetical protein